MAYQPMTLQRFSEVRHIGHADSMREKDIANWKIQILT